MKILDESTLTELYTKNYTIKELAKRFEVNSKTIYRVLKRNKIQTRQNTRKYFFDENLFSKIDNSFKAQLLGLICADGYISKDGKTVSISLDYKDYEYLNSFNHLIYDGAKKLAYICRYKKDYIEKCYKLTIHSVKVVRDLSFLNIKNNKSLTLCYPLISNNLQKYFIRGYFEGDGSIFETKDGNFHVGIIGTVEFLTELSNVIKANTNVDCKVRKTNHLITKTLWIDRQSDVSKFMKWIYSDDLTIVMERKYAYLSKI